MDSLLIVTDMIHALMIKLMDMFVGQCVENVLALFARFDNAQGAQAAQMMRHRGLAHAKHQAEIAYAQFGVR